MADTVEVLRYRLGCPEKPPRAIRLPSIKPATGGDDIFAALKKGAGGYSSRPMVFKLFDRV
jgi:hypothetical protein